MPAKIGSDVDMTSPLPERKRPLEDGDETPRKHKKAKESSTPKDKKSKKSKHHRDETEEERKLRKEKKRAEKQAAEAEEEEPESKPRKEKTKKSSKSATAESAVAKTAEDVTFPFFTQTVSLWIPLYPVGFDKPITSAAEQHLAPLVNHYTREFGGYLLDYHNVNLSENAVRADPNNPPSDSTPTLLATVDEYAVGFGWLTADVDLFVPSRGAYLEGKVILQNEGSIGVTCWDKFNASIEASRLPSGWKYVELDSDAILEDTMETDKEETTAKDDDFSLGELNENGEAATAATADDTPASAQIQSTGYWVNEAGERVTGNLLFRIKDFDVGLAGANGYLAIEGTMLSREQEREMVRRERKKIRATAGRGRTRWLPEFSITQFGREDEEEEKKVEVYKGSRPGTPGD